MLDLLGLLITILFAGIWGMLILGFLFAEEALNAPPRMRAELMVFLSLGVIVIARALSA